MPISEPTRVERISHEAVERVASMYVGVPQHGIRFELKDRAMLTITALQRLAENGVLQPGRGLPPRLFSRCQLLAVDGVVRVMGAAPFAWFSLMRLTCREHAKWTGAVRHLMREGRTTDGPLSDYDLAVVAAFDAATKGLGLTRDPVQWKRATEKALEVLRLPLGDESEEIDQNLNFFRYVIYPERGGLFRSRDGRLLLGDRQVRDGLAKELGINRPRPECPRVLVWKDVDPPTPTLIEGFEDDHAGDQRPHRVAPPDSSLAALERLELLGKVKQVVAARAGGAKRGSVREAAAKHYIAVKGGQISVTKLARRMGLSKSALADEIRQLDCAVRRELGVT